MQETCIADFDETLLSVDSTVFLIRAEKLYLEPRILFLSGCVFLASKLLPRSKQFPIRRRAKYAVLQELHRRGSDTICAKYAPILKQKLRQSLIDQITHTYQAVYIITSAWKPMVEAIIADTPLSSATIFATEFKTSFSDFDICWHTNKLPHIQNTGIKHFDFFTDSLDDSPVAELADHVTYV